VPSRFIGSILIATCRRTRPTPPISPSPSGSSRSCWRRSIKHNNFGAPDPLRVRAVGRLIPFGAGDQLKSLFNNSLSASFPAHLAAAVVSK
jgi:hypothetical protein